MCTPVYNVGIRHIEITHMSFYLSTASWSINWRSWFIHIILRSLNHWTDVRWSTAEKTEVMGFNSAKTNAFKYASEHEEIFGLDSLVPSLYYLSSILVLSMRGCLIHWLTSRWPCGVRHLFNRPANEWAPLVSSGAPCRNPLTGKDNTHFPGFL